MANALAPMMPRAELPGMDPNMPMQRQPVASMSLPTAVAPAPVAAPAAPTANALKPMTSSPYMAPAKKPQNTMLGLAIDGFQRGFDPKGRQADIDQRKADGMEKAKQTLALMQQQRALPAEQRAQWWTQNAPQIGQIIGQDLSQQQVDPNAFTDEAMDGQIAMLSGKLGIAPSAPEPMSAYQKAQIDLERDKLQQPKPPIEVNGVLVDPVTYEPVYTAPKDPKYFNTGQAVVSVGPDGKPSVLYRDPQQPSGSTARYENVSPQQMEALGYPKGTIGQRNIVTNQIEVKSRPSTAQTGQPTESERAGSLHSQIALNGLGNIMRMEAGGYNRAGMAEQAGGLVGGENERLYDQAALEFADGYLRAMTGAAQTEGEVQRNARQFFPQFGDTAAVISQKNAGRLNALKAMRSKAGRAWNPEWDQMIADLETQVGGGQQAPAMSGAASMAGIAAQTITNRPGAGPEDDDTFIDSLFPADGGELPAGVTPEEWDAMTPEEQALFQ